MSLVILHGGERLSLNVSHICHGTEITRARKWTAICLFAQGPNSILGKKPTLGMRKPGIQAWPVCGWDVILEIAWGFPWFPMLGSPERGNRVWKWKEFLATNSWDPTVCLVPYVVSDTVTVASPDPSKTWEHWSGWRGPGESSSGCGILWERCCLSGVRSAGRRGLAIWAQLTQQNRLHPADPRLPGSGRLEWMP